jgi:hypothetical protein
MPEGISEAEARASYRVAMENAQSAAQAAFNEICLRVPGVFEMIARSEWAKEITNGKYCPFPGAETIADGTFDTWYDNLRVELSSYSADEFAMHISVRLGLSVEYIQTAVEFVKAHEEQAATEGQ